MSGTRLIIAAIGIMTATSAAAVPSIDAAGDFIASYTGPANADLDVLSSQVLLRSGIFDFTATLGGDIGLTPGGFYVFGVNRGVGTARFGAIATNVLFDSVVVINNDGTGFARDLLNGTTTALSPGAITLSGASLSALVDASLLPSAGFATQDYAYNLWPRSPGPGIATIADFAPDNGNAAISSVPEPGAWAMLIAGFGVVGASARRRRNIAIA